MTSSIAVVLAAGGSKRLGQPKQLVQYAGEPLVCRAVRQSAEAGAQQALVILGAHSVRIEQALENAVPTPLKMHHAEWQKGLGNSVAFAARAVIDLETPCDAVLFMLCDQPLIPVTHLRAILEQSSESGRIAATRYPDQSLGIPACFPDRYLASLTEISGRQGAKGLIQRENAIGISCDEATLDIDVPADLSRLRRGGNG